MKLIVTVVNRDYCEDIMSAAREAGARGGTIINARGTGTQEDATFFGIHLSTEKEMLLIVANNEEASSVVSAIKRHPVLNERGGGIVFTVNIEEFFLYDR